MKNILLALFGCALLFSVTACEEMFGDFLDKAPGVDVTEDTIFSSKAQAELFMAACYEQALRSEWGGLSRPLSGSSVRSNKIYDCHAIYCCEADEAEHGAVWWIANGINDGSMLIGTNYDQQFPYRFTGLRMVHTMLERVDEVPDADEVWKATIKGEMLFMRAYVHFELFKRYGGMSLVDRRFNADESEAMKIPRSSVEEIVNFIVKDLDDAILVLPDVWSPNWKGRLTKGAALALKSRTLLYAASPKFNTATPVVSMVDPANNKMLCYGNYDVNRWQKAADAAKAVLDWAPDGGVRLITEFAADKNYRYVWEVQDNAEIIYAEKHGNGAGAYKDGDPWVYSLPSTVGGGAAPLPTQNFVEYAYDKRDGSPQTWNASGTDLDQKYAELDYRFRQTIGYSGSYWNPQRGTLNFALSPAPAGAQSADGITGYFMKKWIPDVVNSTSSSYPFQFIWFRLAEFYLNYAEALNEAQGPVQEAYDAVNTIRTRSGMPNLPAGLTKDQFRDRVRKERAVELAFDSHRWWDIHRWLIAGQVLNGPFYKLKIYKNVPVTNPITFNYERVVYENRVWKDRFYYFPFTVNSDNLGTSEMNKGYLVQNPGW